MPDEPPVTAATRPSKSPARAGHEAHSGPSGKRNLVDAVGVHAGAEPGGGRCHVAATGDCHRVDEVLVKVVDELDHAAVELAADRDVVGHRQVLDELAQADAAGVRAHRHAELGRQQQDRQVLVDAADAAGVELQHRDRLCLQQLLEDHAIGHVLAGRDRDRGDGTRDRGHAEHVVGRRRLLDPAQPVRREAVDPVDRLGDVPTLVGVDRQLDVGSDRVANEAHPALVVGEVGADLELDQREPIGDGLARQPLDLGVVVAQPARRGGVRRVAALEQTLDALAATGLGALQDLQRLVSA